MIFLFQLVTNSQLIRGAKSLKSQNVFKGGITPQLTV